MMLQAKLTTVLSKTWLSGEVFGSQLRGPGFKPHWILWVFRGIVLGQDTSEPKPSTDEIKERHE